MKHFNKITRLLLPVFVLMVSLPAFAQLNGTYTVYGTGANYATLEAAANALNSQGVSGPVVFKIRPGNWSSSTTSDATINNVAGASATNTITFEAENGDASTTTITNTNTSSSTSSNYIFRFNSGKYVRVRNLTLNKTYSTRGRVLYFTGSAQYNIIENCVLTGTTSTTTSNSNARVYTTSGTSCTNNIIRNNDIIRGSYGIYWRGNSQSSLSEDNEFSGNTFDNPKSYGIYTYYTEHVKIMNNVINSNHSSSFYALYVRYGDHAKVSGNSGSLTGKTSSLYPIHMYYCDGSSSDRVICENNTFTGQSSSSIYPIYNYYCNYLTYKNNKVTLESTGSGSNYFYISYRGGNNIIEGNEISGKNKRYNVNYTCYYSNNTTINNNKFTQNQQSYYSTSFTLYGLYRSNNVEFNNNEVDIRYYGSSTWYCYWNYYSNNSKMNGNDFTVRNQGTNGSTWYNYWNYYCPGTEVKNNEIDSRGTPRSYQYNYWAYQSHNSTVEGNEYYGENTRSGSSGYGILNYLYYTNNIDFIGNKITAKANSGLTYGMYCYQNGYTGGTYANNEIIASNNSTTCYGSYFLYTSGYDIYNNAIYTKSPSTNYTFYLLYGADADVYNNTFHNEGNSSNSYACRIQNTSNSYHVNFHNNSVTKSGSNGYAFYVYANYATMDYNNVYKPSTSNLFYSANHGGASSVQDWRDLVDQDFNTLSYMPGFMDVSNGDLRPDPANPASWALNGRGVQMAGNGTDINGNPRALTTIDGVPDLGAYEFTPTATPPDCDAVPAVPAASTQQTYLFGQDTVAVVNWGASVPAGTPVMKQYTGTNPPGILSINPTEMFFYTDFQGTGTGLGYDMDLYYKDPWMGTIASESALRLAEKVGTSAWSAYAPTVSSSNVDRNFINTPGVDDVGALFTGVDVKDNAGADMIAEPTPPFCPGSYTVKLLVKNNGNNKINSLKIDWELNGVPQSTINYNTTIDINGSPAGNEAVVTLGTVNFTNDAVNIKAWTHSPNGNQDPVSGDDTLNIDYRAALQGVYTVGGTAPDFGTPSDAVDALNQYGTCGDVVFNIRSGAYVGQLLVDNPVRVVSGSQVTFQSETGNPNDVTISFGTTSSNYPVITLNDADDFTFKNITVTTGTSYGNAFTLQGGTERDSIVGCILNVGSVNNTYNTSVYAHTQNSNFSGRDIVFKDNEVNEGYYGIYFYSNTSSFITRGLVIDGNTFKRVGYYGVYLRYTGGLEFTNNTLTDFDPNSYYGTYIYYPYESPKIIGNTIDKGRGYGFLLYYGRGTSSNRMKFMNNAIAQTKDNSGVYTALVSYCYYMDFMNNSISCNNTSNSYAAYFYYSSSTYGNNKFYNNVISNEAKGPAIIFYNSASTNDMDYNNIYTNGSTFGNYTNSTVSSFSAWKTRSGWDDHSLTYEPGFMSESDLHPDPTNASSWSLNGRALQIAGNDKDQEGNTRIDVRQDGVPDIGAYEFEPDVIPPAATANPASADPGDTQVFTFGEQEVARVTWGTTLPLVAPLTVRQYSGRKGAGVAAAAAPKGSMYFYTSIEANGPSTIYDFDLDLNYMDIWLGDIGTESELRLAHKYNANYPWMVFSGNLSSVNTTTDVLTGEDLIHYGAFTGLENGSITSAFVRPQGSAVICIGNSVQLNAEPAVGGNTYQWYYNGSSIPGATGQTYTASNAGDYYVTITNGSTTVEAVPITVTTIPAPNAIVSANGPLTYCVGNGLTLDAGTASGVKYQWQLNGSDIPGATGNVYAVNQAGSYTVVVENIGCATTSTITPVTSGPLTVDLGSDTTYCEEKGKFLVLDAGYPGAKYTWNTGDTSKQIVVKQSGTYSVQVDGGPNCIDQDAIEVKIDLLPRSSGISYVQNGNTYQFNPGGPAGVTGYLWIFSDGSTSSLEHPTKTIEGDLYVRLVMYNACGSDTSQLGWPLSVSNTTKGMLSMDVYPNPARDVVTISISGADFSEVQILNSVGSVVYRSEVEQGKGKHSADVSGLANGHYMIRAVSSEGVLSKPFDVVR